MGGLLRSVLAAVQRSQEALQEEVATERAARAPSPRMLLLRQQLAAERQQLAAEDDTRLDELATVRGRAAAPGVPGLIRRALPGDETSRVSSESPERSELAY